MNVDAYRELKVLEELSSNNVLTQRHLAKELQVALGLTNLMIRRLVKKGHVKIVNLQQNRLRYLITPKGLVEKTRLTYEYLEYSLYLYRRVREVLRDTLREVSQAGAKRFVLLGTGEVAEIAYLTLKEFDLELVAVVDEQHAGRAFLGSPVLGWEALRGQLFDYAILSALGNGMKDVRKRLHEQGVSNHKIIVIEQKGPKVRAVLPNME